MNSAVKYFVVLVLFCVFERVLCGCSDYTSCETCAEHTSWGASCRWCPVSKKCHTKGSLFNKCSVTQNIIDPKQCSFDQEDYIRERAYSMAMLSAVAYSNDASRYIHKAFLHENFERVFQVIETCAGSANCSGFTAVSHTERIVVVAFRGSEHFKQVVTEALSSLTDAKASLPAGGEVQAYFKDAFDLIWNKLKPKAYDLITGYPSYKVYITGHSLGGALASIASTTIVHDGVATKYRAVLYTFGQPRVGDYAYAKKHDELVKASWRVVHFRDIVVHLPACHELVKGTGCLGIDSFPYHHGTEIFYPEREMNRFSAHKKCLGLPHNEDLKCSNALTVWGGCLVEMGDCIEDHTHYFGTSIGDWWKSV